MNQTAANDARQRVWLVTGISRGIGRAIAEAVVQAGDVLIGTVRDAATAADLQSSLGERAKVVVADITDNDAVGSAVQAAVAAFGRIDVLVNNAGYTLLAGVEEATDAQIRDQFETNTFGMMSVTRAVLPVMRSAGGGRIVVISSVAGVSVAPGMGYYGASKHAVEGFSEALSKEVAEHGIAVTLVQPGLFRTETLGASMTLGAQHEAYDGTVGKLRGALTGLSGHQPGDPALLAAAVVAIADEPAPPLHLPVDPGATGSIRPRLESQLKELDEWAPRFATAALEP